MLQDLQDIYEKGVTSMVREANIAPSMSPEKTIHSPSSLVAKSQRDEYREHYMLLIPSFCGRKAVGIWILSKNIVCIHFSGFFYCQILRIINRLVKNEHFITISVHTSAPKRELS